MGTIAPLNLRN